MRDLSVDREFLLPVRRRKEYPPELSLFSSVEVFKNYHRELVESDKGQHRS